jgi:hypothetical protein
MRPQCSHAHPALPGGRVADACAMKNLVVSWRRQWSVTPQTTDPQFPFGIVSLAAGTSEGHGANMPNFRLAQTASYGILPGPPGSGMEKTFIAQVCCFDLCARVPSPRFPGCWARRFRG